MFAGIHRRTQVHGAKPRRRRKNDEIHATFQNLLVSVKASKLFLRVHLDFLFSCLFEGIVTDIQSIRIHVPHRGEHHIPIRFHGLAGSPRATPPTTYQTDT